MKQLIVVCGATASGKTSLAINLAIKHNTEIISADSRQFFREMNIGTAKPSTLELAQVPHHFINSLSIHQEYSAGEFEKDALQVLRQLFKTHDTVILVGGSGLYIDAVCRGFDDLPKSKIARELLQNQLDKQGLQSLVDELHQVDSSYAQILDTSNKQRVIRALEVYRASGKPYSTFIKKQKENRPFAIQYIGIEWERQQLYKRINTRVDDMMANGLEEEARSLYSLRQLNSLQTVGYQEFFDYFDKKITKEEAIRLIKRNSRRYAKRQLTWFRKYEQMIWCKPGEFPIPPTK